MYVVRMGGPVEVDLQVYMVGMGGEGDQWTSRCIWLG